MQTKTHYSPKVNGNRNKTQVNGKDYNQLKTNNYYNHNCKEKDEQLKYIRTAYFIILISNSIMLLVLLIFVLLNRAQIHTLTNDFDLYRMLLNLKTIP